jgi:hypothetical protein
MANGLFSDRELRALRPRETEYKLAEKAPRGEGRLMLKVHPSGLCRISPVEDQAISSVGDHSIS